MSRIDRYLRALEANTLDDYYEKKNRPNVKLQRYNKHRWQDGGQGKQTGRDCVQRRNLRLKNSK